MISSISVGIGSASDMGLSAGGGDGLAGGGGGGGATDGWSMVIVEPFLVLPLWNMNGGPRICWILSWACDVDGINCESSASILVNDVAADVGDLRAFGCR